MEMLIVEGPEPLKVALKKSARRRSWSLVVKPGGEVVFSMPSSMAEFTARQVIAKHQAWLSAKLARMRKLTPLRTVHPWHAGERIYFRGRELELQLERGSYSSVQFDENVICVRAPNLQAHIIKKVFEDWLAVETESLALNLAPKWAKRFELPQVPQLHFRQLKRSWGQCRSDGKITLHRALSRMPAEFLECVLVHEFCHLFHLNHGREFKYLLGEMIPNWREIKKTHGAVLA